jgi:diadenosine tetraphosphate (Ap4A) HIT family hydrolase
MDCPFCKTDKEKIIKEGKTVFVILSNPRLVKGHLLVIPKRHVERISELSEEERKELFKTVIEFQEKILSKFFPGCDIRQHYRPFQKQNNLKINHLHVHLLPREFKDNLYQNCQIFEKKIFKKLTKEEIKKLNRLFKS